MAKLKIASALSNPIVLLLTSSFEVLCGYGPKFSSLLMILIPSVKLYRLYHLFSEKFWRTLFLFVGSLILLFLDLCGRLPWVSKPEWIPCLCASSAIYYDRPHTEVAERLCFHRCLSVHGGGVHPPWADTPTRWTHPLRTDTATPQRRLL